MKPLMVFKVQHDLNFNKTTMFSPQDCQAEKAEAETSQVTTAVSPGEQWWQTRLVSGSR